MSNRGRHKKKFKKETINNQIKINVSEWLKIQKYFFDYRTIKDIIQAYVK